MRGLKLYTIAIIVISGLMILPGLTTIAYEIKTGNCKIENQSPSISNFKGNFEITRGQSAGDDYWVKDVREEHSYYYAKGYYTHYLSGKTKGWRTQVSKYVAVDYVINPQTKFGWGEHVYNDAPSATFKYPYDNGAAWNYDNDLEDFESESVREAKVKVTTGTAGNDYTFDIGVTGGINSIRIYIPDTLTDWTIGDPEASTTYTETVDDEEIVVVINSGGDGATVETPIESDTWIAAN